MRALCPPIAAAVEEGELQVSLRWRDEGLGSIYTAV